MFKSLIKSTLIGTAVVFGILMLLLHNSWDSLALSQIIVYLIISLAVSFLFVSGLYDGTTKTMAEYNKMRNSAWINGVDPEKIVISVSDKGTTVKEEGEK